MRIPLLAGLAGVIVAFSVACLRPVSASVGAGVVNVQELLMSYPEYRNADEQVRQAESAFQKAYVERLKKLDDARKAGKSEAELRKLQEKYLAEIKPMQSRGRELVTSLQKKLKGRIESAIHAVAKQKGMEMVYDKQAVLFGGTDITRDVATKLKR